VRRSASSLVARSGAARHMRGGEVSLYLLIPMLTGAILFGWIAGMWTHKRAEHWCTACGWQLDCGRCQRAEARSPAIQARRL
jgi:hypothetical protein